MSSIQNLNTWYERIKIAGEAKPLQEIQFKQVEKRTTKVSANITVSNVTASKVPSLDAIVSSIFD